MSENPRTTLMGWRQQPDGTPLVLLQLDTEAVQDLIQHGAVLVRAPRDAAGHPQFIALLGQGAGRTEVERLIRAVETAPEDLPPLVPIGDLP